MEIRASSNEGFVTLRSDELAIIRLKISESEEFL